MNRPLYALFDKDEIDGTVYAIGDEIPANINPGVRTVLEAQGRIGATKPNAAITIPSSGLDKDAADMSREELEGAMMVATRDRVAEASDDDLRNAVAPLRHHDELDRAEYRENHQPHHDRREPSPHHVLPDQRRRRPQRQPHADFVVPLRHEIRNNAVDPHHREHERNAAEERQQHRVHPRGLE